MVTSTGSGLAVPDWPLSYGSLFPPMVGGVFYEHSHRMAAAAVGFLMLCLAIWLGLKEKRKWVRICGFTALGAVIAQGILGGLTVKFFLPKPVSIAHGILAQTFFILTIILAYSQSEERKVREEMKVSKGNPDFIKLSLLVSLLIYIQLILGALMRHTGSGLAIPDFPTMGGSWIPSFDEKMVSRINVWRFMQDLEPVTKIQVLIHFFHRLWALIITIAACILVFTGLKYHSQDKKIRQTIFWLASLIIIQLSLGIMTVLTQKSPVITSLHVVTGAVVLGISVLLCLRASPIQWKEFRRIEIK